MTPEIPPEKITVKFTNPDSVDLSTLNCDDFVEWLKAKKFSTEHCQAFKGVYIIIIMCVYKLYPSTNAIS